MINFHHNRKIFSSLGVLMLVSVLFSSCSGGESSADAEPVQELGIESAAAELKPAFDGFQEYIASPDFLSHELWKMDLYHSLKEDPYYRQEVRKTMRNLAKEQDYVHVADQAEPGIRFETEVKIYDNTSGEPISDVLVELVHTDSSGVYFSEEGPWNPRIFAFLKTDDDGTFLMNTILPKGYADDSGNEVPGHIHITLEKEGYSSLGTEFSFMGDPLIESGYYEEGLLLANYDRSKGYFAIEIGMSRE